MELWHALNRGVDGRPIFMDDRDRARFVHNLYEFNDADPVRNLGWRLENSDLRDHYIKKRKLLVDIHGWVLMKNHYHLLFSERVENGLILFLRKLNTGYANYFNERYKRQGTLFQGRTKKILIKREEHFLYILHYVHLNPLDYLRGADKWRVRDKSGIGSSKEAFEYLNGYRWSSYLDYVGRKNFPSILTTSLFGSSEYSGALKDYLSDAELDGLQSLQLE